MLGEMIKIFCYTDDKTPTMQQILELLSEEGFDIRFEDEAGLDKSDMENPSWTEATIVYNKELEPICLECWREDDSDEFEDLLDESIEIILDNGVDEDSDIVENLNKSNFVINILPIMDADEEADDIYSALMNYLNSSYHAIAVIDEDGVYDGDELVVEFE